MSLYHKYRPDSLNAVKGNEETVEALKNMLQDKSKMPRVFLFHGPAGCGKTTLARIIRTTLEISDQDYSEIDSAQFNGVDMVRELRKTVMYKPLESTHRMWTLDEVHQLTGPAQESMLKIMEDTPSHVIFALCTTEPNKLKASLKSRCQQFPVQALSDEDLKSLLIRIVKKEKDSVDEVVIKRIIQDSQGQVRSALQILEKVLNTNPENRLKIAEQAAVEQSESVELTKALMSGASWKKVSEILKGLKGQDPEGVRRAVLGYATAVLLNKDDVRLGLILEAFTEPTYNSGFSQIVYAAYQVTKG